MKQPWVLDWEEVAAAGPEVVGGKGWNLGRLDRYGFDVPPGGVLTSAAYELFMSAPALAQLQTELSDITADDATTPQNIRRLGLSDKDVLCAVVLCRMVGADGDPYQAPAAAGVSFSCDPRTGRRDVVTIGAVPGLGVHVVDGSADAEEITIQLGLGAPCKGRVQVGRGGTPAWRRSHKTIARPTPPPSRRGVRAVAAVWPLEYAGQCIGRALVRFPRDCVEKSCRQ